MSLVVDSQCFPCIDYMKMLLNATNIKIEKYDRFRKMSFRNRYMIAGANGLNNLTIPVVGGREQKALMKDIKTDESAGWRTRHWKSLLSAYHKAPFFEFYSADVKKLLFFNDDSLFLFNNNILTWLSKLLDINVIVEFTERYSDTFLEEVDGRNLIVPAYYNRSSDWEPRYVQVFEDRNGFQPNLSILDLIFCEGPNSAFLLRKSL